METTENKKNDDFIKDMKHSSFFRTLTPQKSRDGIYCADIKFTSYTQLLYTVKDLLQIALHALYNDGLENSGEIQDPTFHLTSVLEIAVQLLPCSEAEGMDIMHKLYLEIQNDQENKNEKTDNNKL